MPQESSPQTSPRQADPHHPFEWLLPSLVELGRRTGFRPAVTLAVGGFLVSGELVDGSDYFAELVRQAGTIPEGAVDPGAKAALTELLERFAGRYAEAPAGTDHSPRAEPEHVHLLNARVFHPGGGPVPAAGTLAWRVRLDAVQALTLRSLEWESGALR